MKLHLLLCTIMLAGCGTAATVDIEVSDSGVLPTDPFLDAGSDSPVTNDASTDSATVADVVSQDAGQDSSESICVYSSPQVCQNQYDNCQTYEHLPTTICLAGYYMCMGNWTAACANPAQACGYMCMEKYEVCIEITGVESSCQAALNACSIQCSGGLPPAMDAGSDANDDAMTHGCRH